MFFLGNMFGLSLRIFGIFAKQSLFFRMAKALPNPDFWLTSWPLMTTCRGSQLCHNGLFTINWNKRKVQLVNLSYLGISGKAVCWLYRETKSDKINSDKKNADISLKQSAKLQEIEVVKSKKVKLQESIDFKENKLKQGWSLQIRIRICLLFL